jgi:hypothetical protein
MIIQANEIEKQSLYWSFVSGNIWSLYIGEKLSRKQIDILTNSISSIKGIVNCRYEKLSLDIEIDSYYYGMFVKNEVTTKVREILC